LSIKEAGGEWQKAQDLRLFASIKLVIKSASCFRYSTLLLALAVSYFLGYSRWPQCCHIYCILACTHQLWGGDEKAFAQCGSTFMFEFLSQFAYIHGFAMAHVGNQSTLVPSSDDVAVDQIQVPRENQVQLVAAIYNPSLLHNHPTDKPPLLMICVRKLKRQKRLVHSRPVP